MLARSFDLIVTYFLTIISAMLLAPSLHFYPLIIASFALLGLIPFNKKMMPLYGLCLASMIILISYFWIKTLAICTAIGFLTIGSILCINHYYAATRSDVILSVATHIIRGLALSMGACAFPCILLCLGILFSYLQAGMIGVSVALMGMLSIAGIMLNLGIKYDSYLTKIYTITLTTCSSLALFFTYPSIFWLHDPFAITGLFFGGVLIYLMAARKMKAIPVLAIFALFLALFPFFTKTILCTFLSGVALGVTINGFLLAIELASCEEIWQRIEKANPSEAGFAGEQVGRAYGKIAVPRLTSNIKLINILALLTIYGVLADK